MKIWLDDRRFPPRKWHWIMSVEVLIPFFEENFDKIEVMSLDNDLGWNSKTGYEFLLWLEEKVFNGVYKSIPEIRIHTGSPVGEQMMKQILHNIMKGI